MNHKSGYLLKIKKQSQNYNSISTGLTAILSLEIELTHYSGFFIV